LVDELKKELHRYLSEKREDTIRLCSEMVKIPSENPPGDMREIASFIAGWLGDYGFFVEAYEPDKGKVNLVAKIGGMEGPALILNGHMDVVSAGNAERWDFPPFCGEVRGGRILGRGAADMKGGLASIMMASTAVLEILGDPPGRLVLNIVSDEEVGGHYGSEWCVENGKVDGDGCIIGEPTGANSSFVGEKGICWLRLKSKGIPAHGSLPMLGENAIERLVRAFPIARRLEKEKIKTPSELSETIKASQKFHMEIGKKTGLMDRAKLRDIAGAVDHCTANIGLISGGVKINVVPESCSAEIDLRIPAGLTSSKVKGRLEELLGEEGLGDIECELLLESDPSYTAPSLRIYAVLKKNVREVMDVEVTPLLVTGGTDGRYFRLKSIPTVCYGPGEFSVAHAYNEYLLIDELLGATKVIAGTIKDFITQLKE